MTVLSRGARVRRGGRRPGWVLLTALLVLAMGASSALVFTNQVKLLKLAVILALWAAVAGAFVSVLYRRQSDADQSRVRDLKLVYDLQLDREISARREYELTVESQLRRELTSELRAAAADDLAALRAELGALRTSLEILFDTDFQQRPALETFEAEVPPTRAHSDRAYGDWERNGQGTPVDWVASDRVTSSRRDNPPGRNGGPADDSGIIDVPEEPLLPPRQPVQPAQPAPPPPNYGRGQYGAPQEVPQEVPYVVSQEPPYMAPPPEPEPRFEPLHRPPPPPPPSQPEPQPQMQDWQPAGHWGGVDPSGASAGEPSGRQPRARHYSPDEVFDDSSGVPAAPWEYGETGRRARARHSADYRDHGVRNFAATNEPAPAAPPPAAAPPPPRMTAPSPPEPAPRHGGGDPLADENGPGDGPPSGGQSVADLLARLQVDPSGGGRRRRREA
jgi:hypothetical protein